jgi:four helix bundle protein
MKVKDYKELLVWQNGVKIANQVYEETERFSGTPKYSLGTHLEKTSVSISSNIAEGFIRNHNKEYIQFCYISLGSCAELETQLIIANVRNLLRVESYKHIITMLNEQMKMTRGLIKSLENQR